MKMKHSLRSHVTTALLILIWGCTGVLVAVAQSKGDGSSDADDFKPPPRGGRLERMRPAPVRQEPAPARRERPEPSRPRILDVEPPARPELPVPAQDPSAPRVADEARPGVKPDVGEVPVIERSGPAHDVIDRRRAGDLFRPDADDLRGRGLPDRGGPGVSPFERHGMPMPRERGMPRREIPGRDMGPAGAARQPPSGFPFDGRRGPGTVASGGADDGIVRREQGLGKTRYYIDDGSVIIVHHPPPGSGGRDTYERHPPPGSGDPVTIHYYNDDGELVTEVLESTRQPAAEQEETAGQDQQEEGEEEMPLAPIIQPGQQEEEATGETTPDEPDKDDPDEEEETQETTTRPGDPDDWGTGEPLPEDRFGVRPGPTVRTPTDPFAQDDEQESAHAPLESEDAETLVREGAEKVGDYREPGGPDVSISVDDPLRDPPRDVEHGAP